MNILILSWRGPGDPFAGGAEHVTLTHARYWKEQGNSVYWFTSVYPGCRAEEQMEGINLIRRGSSMYYGVIARAFWWYLFSHHPKFDIVVDQFHGLPFFTPLYVRSSILGFIHELGSQVVQYNPWPKPLNLLPIFFAPLCEPLVFKLFYKNIPFMTVSQSTKQDLEDLSVKKITIVANGIEVPKSFHTPLKQKLFTVMFLSQLTKDKGIEDAIQAYKLIKNKIPSSQFWIVGKGEPDYVRHLQNLAPEAKFFGYVSEQKKYELLAKSHVLVFPSIHEGWGLVILEAASVSTPTIAYRVSGVKDAIVHNQTGLTTDEQTPESLSKLILELNSNKRLYSRLILNAKKWSQNFLWNESIKNSTALITRITKPK